MGPIGVAVNGVPLFNQMTIEQTDAMDVEAFDTCCGHPSPQGEYHYHRELHPHVPAPVPS